MFQKTRGADCRHIGLIGVSFFICNSLVDLATDFISEEMRIEVLDVDGLNRLNVPIYSFLPKSFLFGEQENMVRDIKFVSEREIYKCFMGLFMYNDRVCINDMHYVHMQSSMHKKLFDRGLRKISFDICSAFYGFRLEKSSPFVEEFKQLLQRSLDTGLIERPSIQEFLQSHKQDYDDEDYNIVS